MHAHELIAFACLLSLALLFVLAVEARPLLGSEPVANRAAQLAMWTDQLAARGDENLLAVRLKSWWCCFFYL